MLLGHTDYVRSVVVTYDNKYVVSGSEDKTLRVWNLEYECQEDVLQGHTGILHGSVITRDKKYCVSWSKDETVRVWNLQEKKQEAVLYKE